VLVDPGGGAATSFAGIHVAVDAIVAAASEGFAISENGGQPLLNAIQDLQTEVRTALNDSSILTTHPPLGSTPNANIYKPFLATIASDPTQGAITVLKKLQTDLSNAHTAIQKAMNNYHATDQGNAGTLNSATPM
jgi:hypothetical protein